MGESSIALGLVVTSSKFVAVAAVRVAKMNPATASWTSRRRSSALGLASAPSGFAYQLTAGRFVLGLMSSRRRERPPWPYGAETVSPMSTSMEPAQSNVLRIPTSKER